MCTMYIESRGSSVRMVMAGVVMLSVCVAVCRLTLVLLLVLMGLLLSLVVSDLLYGHRL